LVDAIGEAFHAGRLTQEQLAAADREIELAEDISLAMVGSDPPWYTILFPGLRSELFALRQDRLPDAIHLAEQALSLARAHCPELIPKHARLHASHLVQAEQFEQALAALTSAEADAKQDGHLRELAHIQWLAVVALVRSSSAPPLVSTQMAALRETLGATGSHRIRADSLLDLAGALPPQNTIPDPIALLDEAHALFLNMPMPGKEARCLEAAGDVLLARGKHVEAKRRYLAARRRLERYGLGLRLPLVTAKIDKPS
jgi:hypothetical protein